MIEVPVTAIHVSRRKRTLNITKVAELAHSIVEIGLLNPITVRETGGTYELITGAHRLEAFKVLEIATIPAQLFDGDALDAELAEIDENLRRNELTVLEQGEHLQRREEILEDEGRRRKVGRYPFNGDTVSPLKTTADLAAEIGISERSTQRRIQAARNIIPEVKDIIRDTGIANSTTQLLELARMNTDDQLAAANVISNSTGEMTIPEVKRMLNRQERIERIQQISAGNAELKTARRYPVVYADPPWRYEHSVSSSRDIENQYPTMELADICALPVNDIALDDAVLFMWATNPKLEEALQVIAAWGFRYRTNMVWVKDRIGMGYYARQKHELLLIATRGELPTPEPSSRPPSVIEGPRTEHSRKPPEVYCIIDQMYPDLPKIELFARTNPEGWDTWGNQV